MSEHVPPGENPDDPISKGEEAIRRSQLAILKSDISQILATEICLDFPHYLDPQNVGEQALLGLTYRAITRKEAVSTHSPGLPHGFEQCTDEEVQCLLQKGHLDRMRKRYAARRASYPGMECPNEIAGYPVWLHGQDTYDQEPMRPGDLNVVAGEHWHRILQIDIDIEAEQSALLLEPWMQLFSKGGAIFPMLYAKNNPAPSVLRTIVEDYNQLAIQA